ncbi:MAG: hypothetical protein U1F15_07630 [Burkholderiales bacterium]
MRAMTIGAVALAASLGLAGPAMAAPCYLIYDRNDVVVFRDVVPPFDLSNPKSAERAALRRQGALLLIAEFEKCDPAGFISPTTGGTTASVDDIIVGIKPMLGSSIAANSGASSVPSQTASASGNAPGASVIRLVPSAKY